MAALRRVEWTAQAERDLEAVHAFVLERWSEREANHLLDLVQEFEALVARWPFGYKRAHHDKDLRLGLVHRNTTAVYRVFPDRVVIITVFDNRSNTPR